MDSEPATAIAVLLISIENAAIAPIDKGLRMESSCWYRMTTMRGRGEFQRRPARNEFRRPTIRATQIGPASSARLTFEPQAPKLQQPTAWQSRPCGLHSDRVVPTVHHTRKRSQGGQQRRLWQVPRSDRSDAKTGHALPMPAPTPSIPMLSERGAD